MDRKRVNVLTNTNSLVVDWLTQTFLKELMIVMNEFFQSSRSPYALWYTLAAGTGGRRHQGMLQDGGHRDLACAISEEESGT